MTVHPLFVSAAADLRADEAPADDRDANAVAGQIAEASVVVERTEVDDVATGRQLARSSACRQKDLLVRVGVAGVVARRAPVEVECCDRAAGVHVDPEFGGAAEYRVLVLPGPQRLGERRSSVWLVWLASEEADRPVRIVITDPAARGIPRHASSDDEVAIRGHPGRS